MSIRSLSPRGRQAVGALALATATAAALSFGKPTVVPAKTVSRC